MKLSFLRFFDFINNESGSSSAPYRSRRRQPHLGSMRPPDNVGTPPADSRGTEAWQPICKPRFAAPRTPSAAHHCGQHFDAHPGSTIFIPRQCNLSDKPSLRTDGRFGRTALMNSPTRPAARRSNNPPLRAACCSRPLGQIPVFWQLAVSAGAPHTASADTIRQTATPSAPRAPDRRRPRTPGPWRRRRRAASSPPWQEDRNPPRSRRTQRRRA